MDTIISLVSNVRVLTVLVLGIIVLTLVVPALRRRQHTQPDKKRMSRKAKAEVTNINRQLYNKESGEIWVDYAFTVDGRQYTGCGWYNKAEYDLFHRVTVFYDPEMPSKNCTNLERSRMGTTGPVFILGLIAVITLLVFVFGT